MNVLERVALKQKLGTDVLVCKIWLAKVVPQPWQAAKKPSETCSFKDKSEPGDMSEPGYVYNTIKDIWFYHLNLLSASVFC